MFSRKFLRTGLKGNDAVDTSIGGAFRFWVELEGLLVGGFSEVSGLQSETEVEEYNEGGVNDFVHAFPKKTKSPPLVLKRGLTRSPELWEWYEDVSKGRIKRKNGSVILMNHAGQEICRWNFFEAYPVKWRGPNLNALNNEIAIETLEILHNGLKTIFNK